MISAGKNAVTILKADLVWDGRSNEPMQEAAVMVEGGRITNVGLYEEIRKHPHHQVLDWPDAAILPGLIDAHTHLSMDASMDDYLDHMTDPVNDLLARAKTMMRRDLDSGVTTCRCLGDREFIDIELRQSVVDGDTMGPRLLVATRGIRSPQGHGFVGYPFEGKDSIRTAIRENLVRGADFIKIYITGTLKGNGQLPSCLTREEIETAIGEAHDAGVRVASHCVGGVGLDWALELGLDTLEHAYQISDPQVERLTKSKTFLVLTPASVLSEERVRKLPQSLIDGHLVERRQMFESMASTIKAAIPFALGTDGLHGSMADEIGYAMELGASTVNALRGATIRGAIACGVENETGSLEAGKSADIIVVEGNPWKDTRAMKKIQMVMKQGAIILKQKK